MSPKFLKLCVACSLLVNVLLLGVSFGHMGRSLVGLECKEQSSHRVNVHELLKVLPQDKQQQLAADVAHFDSDEKQLDDRLKEGRRKVITLLQTLPLDKTAYTAQVRVLDALHAQHATEITDIIAEIAGQCNDEQRAELTAKLSGMMLEKK